MAGRDGCKDTTISVNGESYGLVILATGVALDPSRSPLIAQLRSKFPTSFVGAFPELNSSLRWSKDEDIFVVGCNAGLQLGPGALNLMGAMRGGRLIAEELHELMWADVRVHRTKLQSNLFTMLEASGSSSSDVDGSDDESEGDETCATEDQTQS